MSKLQLRITQSVDYAPFCRYCGRWYSALLVGVAELLDGETRIGNVCPSCLKSGSVGASAQLKEAAAQSRSHAQELDALAEEALHVKWCDVEEFYSVANQIGSAFADACEKRE